MLKKALRILLLCANLFLLVCPLFSEQDIQKIGLVDSSRIISTYFQDSKAMRELKELKDTIVAVSNEIKEEIFELKRQKVDAERRSDREEVLRLETIISEKERFLKEYIQVKNKEYKRRQSLALEDSFLLEVTEAIEYIAISEGYSVILEKQNPIFLYYSIDVDITDKVLEYLLEQSGKASH
jgi:Skp family chaperone for outer membrane proteins